MPTISQPNVWKKCRLGKCSESENRRQIFIGSGSVEYWIRKSEKPGFIYCPVLIIFKDKVWGSMTFEQVQYRYQNITYMHTYYISMHATLSSNRATDEKVHPGKNCYHTYFCRRVLM